MKRYLIYVEGYLINVAAVEFVNPHIATCDNKNFSVQIRFDTGLFVYLEYKSYEQAQGAYEILRYNLLPPLPTFEEIEKARKELYKSYYCGKPPFGRADEENDE